MVETDARTIYTQRKKKKKKAKCWKQNRHGTKVLSSLLRPDKTLGNAFPWQHTVKQYPSEELSHWFFFFSWTRNRNLLDINIQKGGNARSRRQTVRWVYKKKNTAWKQLAFLAERYSMHSCHATREVPTYYGSKPPGKSLRLLTIICKSRELHGCCPLEANGSLLWNDYEFLLYSQTSALLKKL